jgi:O-antigen/teichoic acid export membrane protein
LLLIALCWPKGGPLLRFQVSDIRSFWEFGAFQFGDRIVAYLSTRADQVLIGSLLGLEALGYYTVAFRLTVGTSAQIATVFTRVAYPVFAAVQTARERGAAAYLTAVRMLTLGACPALIGLAVIAPTFVLVVIGTQWDSAVPVIQILCLVAVLRVTNLLSTPVLLAQGKAGAHFFWSFGDMMLKIPLITLGIVAFGIEGAAIALFVSEVVSQVVRALVVDRLLGVTQLQFLKSVGAPLMVSLLMALSVLLSRVLVNDNSASALLVQIGTGVVVYFLGAALFLRKDLIEVFRALLPDGRIQ